AAGDEQPDAVVAAIVDELAKSRPNFHVLHRKAHDFFPAGCGQQGEHAPDAFPDTDALPEDVVLDLLPSRRIEMFHDADDVVVDGDGTVKVAKDDRLAAGGFPF